MSFYKHRSFDAHSDSEDSDTAADLDSKKSLVEETTSSEDDDDNDESIRFVRKVNKKSRLPNVIISESETDDSEDRKIEKEAFSPHTRRSITGVRLVSLTSTESEDNDDSSYHHGEDASGIQESGQEIHSCENQRSECEQITIRNIDEEEIENLEKGNHKNKLTSTPTVESKHIRNNEENTQLSDDKLFSCDEESNAVGIEEVGESSEYGKVTTKQSTSKEEINSSNISIVHDMNKNDYVSKIKTLNNRRSSMNFNMSIRNKFSSTMCENTSPSMSKVVSKTDNKSDLASHDVETDKIEKSNKNNATDVIEISSSYESSDSPNTSKSSSVVELQPKITSAFSTIDEQKENQKQQKVPVTALQRTKVVSKKYFTEQTEKLRRLKDELTVSQNLYNSVGLNLPDKGQRMLSRLIKLKEDIKIQSEYISTLVIGDNADNDNNRPPDSATSLKPLSWDELQALTNKIEPKYTGKQGLATFTAQKVLTIDRLKDIHGSLETCPNESVLADEPKGLKISLMNHQRHALAWMKWREKQKPRGGILADDMGLGKTLSMISLVLDTIERDPEESDEDENENSNGPSYRKTYNGGTLVICPASLIRQWESEVKNHTKRNTLNVYLHHGNNREVKARRLAQYDIVITTYNIATRESKGLLGDIRWNRIILDEAHIIRNHKTQTSIAVCNLRSKTRWALTGTPIQNREIDLYAIIKFLRCTPFDDIGHWKKWIDNKSAGGQQRLNALMKSLMLRRTKIQLQESGALNNLPLKQIELIDIVLEKEEMNVYQKILLYSQTLFAQFLLQREQKASEFGDFPVETKLSKAQNEHYNKMYKKLFPKLNENGASVKSHEILVLLLRLRQICCHPGLINSMLDDEENLRSIDDFNSTSNHQEVDLLEQLKKLEINEKEQNLANNSKNSPEDSLVLHAITSNVLSKSNPVFDSSRPSSKFRKVLEYIVEKVSCTNDKAIIVSQWVSVLNILQPHILSKGIQCSSINGSIPVSKRNEIVTEFNDPRTKVKILLLSLTAGGVGLNLVGANHLFLIDLHWNPQLEAQASDRIYRVGQQKPVFIYKFLCKDTVEERIKSLQDRKLTIANSVLTGVKANNGSKLSIEDLKNLFGL